MKVNIVIDCTPEEARRFMGLPDLQPLQAAVLKDMEDRTLSALQSMNPEAMMKGWMPAGLQGAEQFQTLFWSQWQQALANMAGKSGAGERKPKSANG